MDTPYSTLLLYSLAGVLGVTNMILWGVYADLLVETFHWRKVFRSYLLAVIYAFVLALTYPSLNLVIVALSIIGLERISTEIYKAFIRVENQDKYKIPSHLGIHWPSPIKRCVGVLLHIVLISIWFIHFPALSMISKIIIVILTGLSIALGGMLKDAPYEGFDGLKFWRSPSVTVFAGVVLGLLFPDLDPLPYAFSIGGLERIMSECYKKILTSKIPGKFHDTLPRNKSWSNKRNIILPFYVANLLSILALYWI
ncbi:MAG: hypothetical protein UZ21_OP11001000432 [Microgenomates bacterium OLB22]|nr:MAG: hypothetical protein UZ21_OP11001000432 [Microgenomates bacterium OLB22]